MKHESKTLMMELGRSVAGYLKNQATSLDEHIQLSAYDRSVKTEILVVYLRNTGGLSDTRVGMSCPLRQIQINGFVR